MPKEFFYPSEFSGEERDVKDRLHHEGNGDHREEGLLAAQLRGHSIWRMVMKAVTGVFWELGRGNWLRVKNGSSWINLSCLLPMLGQSYGMLSITHEGKLQDWAQVQMVTIHWHTFYWPPSLLCLIPSLVHSASWNYKSKPTCIPHTSRPLGD